jgi:hypothetical protein
MDDTPWYAPGHKIAPPSPPEREEVFGFVMTKDVRTMTGVMHRVDETRWEAVYWLNGGLYLSETLDSRELAEQHLAKHKDALDAAGWKEG